MCSVFYRLYIIDLVTIWYIFYISGIRLSYVLRNLPHEWLFHAWE